MYPPQPEQAKLSSRSHDRSRSVESRPSAGDHCGPLDRFADRDRLHGDARAPGGDARRVRRARPRQRYARARRPRPPPSRWTHRRGAAHRRLGVRPGRRGRRDALAQGAGRGFPVGPAGVVPIVPTAVIFDFDLAPGGKADRWPTADDAYRACTVASADVVEGSVGAGTGATVGKALGPRAAMKGGVGSWAASGGDIVVGALVVLNAVGNILDGAGAVLAGARAADGTFADALTHFARGGAPFGEMRQ